MFKLEFETDNAAFVEGQEHEVGIILEHICSLVRGGYTTGPVYDSNGNTVGKWSLELPDESEKSEEES